MTYLIIPGLGGSGENHWQSIWHKKFSNSVKLQQENWDAPLLDAWLQKMNEAVIKIDGPILFIAHSLGVSLVNYWLINNKNPNIKGALLVAPADVESETHTPDIIRNFAPIPLHKLSFPSIVVASENDAFVDLKRAEFFATKWGSEFRNIGFKGHINSESNLGEWDDGLQILEELTQQIIT